MLVDKLIMPYVLATHHPMVHFALFVAGLIVHDGFQIKPDENQTV